MGVHLVLMKADQWELQLELVIIHMHSHYHHLKKLNIFVTWRSVKNTNNSPAIPTFDEYIWTHRTERPAEDAKVVASVHFDPLVMVCRMAPLALPTNTTLDVSIAKA